MAYQDFLNDYKNGNIGDCIVMYGVEDYLMDWAVDKIISDNVDEQSIDLDVRIIEDDNATAYDIMCEARAYSMFSDKRIVVVKNYLPMIKRAADPGMDDLLDFAAEIAGTEYDNPAILIFVIDCAGSGSISSYGKSIMKVCKSYEFARLEKRELTSFISKRVKSAGKILSSREMSHLIDVTGYYNRDSAYHLNQMDSDLFKLTSACETDVIERDLIDEIMMGDGDKFTFNLIDAMSAGDRGKALEIAETIIRDEDGAFSVLALLCGQFEIMYDALELSDRGMSITAMSKATGAHEFRMKKAYSSALKYGRERISSLLASLYDSDIRIKSGDIDKDTALELFVVKAASRHGIT